MQNSTLHTDTNEAIDIKCKQTEQHVLPYQANVFFNTSGISVLGSYKSAPIAAKF